MIYRRFSKGGLKIYKELRSSFKVYSPPPDERRGVCSMRVNGITLAFAVSLGALLCCPGIALAVQLSSPQKATVKFIESGLTVQLEPGQSLDVDLDGPAEVHSGGRLPMILLPVQRSNSRIELASPALAEIVEGLKQQEVSQLLSLLLSEIADIQDLIRRKRVNEAHEKVKSLETRYPQVGFLKFLRASTLLLKGQQEEARRLAEEALKAHPDYEEGRQFVQKLGGKP